VVNQLSLHGRPWAYEKIYDLETRGANEFDIAKVEAGRFYEMGNDLVFLPKSSTRQKTKPATYGYGKQGLTIGR